MKLVMGYLNMKIPRYDRGSDPIFHHATQLHPLEEHTITTQVLSMPEEALKPISQEQIDDAVSGIKVEEGTWRPLGREIVVATSQPNSSSIKMEPSPSGFSLSLFDRLYQEVAMKILKETNYSYYRSLYEQPLDLSKPKVECNYCYDTYSSTICLFYVKREPKVPDEGRPCYCCDSDDDVSESQQDTDNKKTPSNPGWFGKGYRKRMKKKR